MRSLKCLFLVLLVGCSHGTKTAGYLKRPERAIVISIDGFRNDLYPKTVDEAPILMTLLAKGAHAKGLVPVYPSITYANHATIVSGVRPDRHGIWSNKIFSRTQGPMQSWYFSAQSFHVPTLWDSATQDDKTVSLVGWPSTVGAKAKWIIPEVFPERGFDMKQVWELTEKYTEKSLMTEIQETLDRVGFGGDEERDRWMTDAALHILKKYKPDLTFIHLTSLDITQHKTGHGSPATKKTLRFVDGLVGELIGAIDLEKTLVVILGDHGFADVTKLAHINAVLAKAGLLKTNESGDLLEWKAVAHVNGAQAAVYVLDESVKPRLMELLNQHSPGIYRILDQAKLQELGALPEAFCALDPLDGYAIGSKMSGEYIEKIKGIHGEHGLLPEDPKMHAGFVAVGAGVEPGLDLGLIQMEDVAPTLAYMLDLELEGVEGRTLNLGMGLP